MSETTLIGVGAPFDVTEDEQRQIEAIFTADGLTVYRGFSIELAAENPPLQCLFEIYPLVQHAMELGYTAAQAHAADIKKAVIEHLASRGIEWVEDMAFAALVTQYKRVQRGILTFLGRAPQVFPDRRVQVALDVNDGLRSNRYDVGGDDAGRQLELILEDFEATGGDRAPGQRLWRNGRWCTVDEYFAWRRQ